MPNISKSYVYDKVKARNLIAKYKALITVIENLVGSDKSQQAIADEAQTTPQIVNYYSKLLRKEGDK